MDAALINWARHREVGLETTWQFPATPLLSLPLSISLSLSGVKRVGRWAAGRSGGSSAFIFHWRPACPSPYIAGAPSGNAWLGSRLRAPHTAAPTDFTHTQHTYRLEMHMKKYANLQTHSFTCTLQRQNRPVLTRAGQRRRYFIVL